MQCTQSNSSSLILAQCRSKRTWTVAEQILFKRLYKQFRRDFKLYVPYFDGRTEGQIKRHFYQNVIHNNKLIQQYKTESQIFQDITVTYYSSQNLNDESLFESTTMTFDGLDMQQ
ncbi:SANT/Myb_domain [Hexamita inflata]|uniref:SANT/Myb domain n=1 Tax=Hexamita inflata TaxID=28002 RepID=A0AA86R0A0_9EUKA|nr:SANT/Myb domain [Hexamita inflata]